MKRLITAMLSATLLALPILNISAAATVAHVCASETSEVDHFEESAHLFESFFEENDYVEGARSFYSDEMYGKIFAGGRNEEISSKDQLDTVISAVELRLNNGFSVLKFNFEGQEIQMNAYLLEAEKNIQDGHHFVLSPYNFSHPYFEFDMVGFTTKATEYDLITANSEMEGATVLSLLLRDVNTQDLYYWQGTLNANEQDEAISVMTIQEASNVNNLNIGWTQEEYDAIRENANERSYYNPQTTSLSMTQDEYEEMIAQWKERKRNEESNSTSSVQASKKNNPFYGDGIPNEAFQNPTYSWAQNVASVEETPDYVRSVNYYTYSFMHGSVGNIYTQILLLQFTTTEFSGTTPAGVPRAQLQLELKVLANETVVYYVGEDRYDYELGKNNMTNLYPSIELKKEGNVPGHFLTDRKFGGRYCIDGTREAIKEAGMILLDLLDNVFSAITTTIDILKVIGATAEPTTVTMGADMYVYGYTIEEQLLKYNQVFGGNTVDLGEGFLNRPDDYFFVEGHFKADTVEQAGQTMWVMGYNLG